MKQFENIEKLIRRLYPFIISEERYGDDLLLGLDHLFFGKQPLADLISRTTGSDSQAIEAYDILDEFSEKYPQFLYVRAATLSEGLEQLESKAEKWLKLSHAERKAITFHLLQQLYPNEDWSKYKHLS